MATTSTSSSSGGIGFFGLLAIVFITLKLCGVITWSWWWVTAPLWGSFVLVLVLVAFWVLGIVVHRLMSMDGRQRIRTGR